MLETLREYALERLAESGEDAAVRAAPRRASSWRSPRGPDRRWRDRISSHGWTGWRRSIRNLRAALDWALGADGAAGLRLAGALARFWQVRGHLIEGRAWLDRALRPGGSDPSPARGDALTGAGIIAFELGDVDRAAALQTEALELFRGLGDRRGVARALQELGWVAWVRGDPGRAVALLEEGMGLARGLGDRRIVAWALAGLGAVAMDRGELDRAAALHEEALALFRLLADRRGAAYALVGLGRIARTGGELEPAAGFEREALALYHLAGSRLGAAYCLDALAGVAAERQPARAARLYGAAEELLAAAGAPLPNQRRLDHDRGVAEARGRLGEAAFAAEWAAGRALPLDRAIAEALDPAAAAPALPEPDALPPPDTEPSAIPPALGTGPFGLTPREREVLRLLCERRTDPEIADTLFVSYRTVTTHVGRVLAKLGVDSRREAAAAAARHGLA